ncbi:hypothetical protein QTG54_009838 [Skeletonema marinoi]|uniref:Ionotropic glutamate receptor C-terminal domain-containing protein n=1 Tax=Skeletonema marinoi TaxID=267567 RepID=A0AAD8Y622_9STRA|nr:hypothetical protein QTG54_009838 [Skeletonema marinoi]
MSTGNEGCNCINQTSVLASLQNRGCTTATGQPGVYLTLGGSCVAYDYGSSACLQHDFIHDPICQTDASTTAVPPYCFQTWCYVDASTCKTNSEEYIYKSEYFSPSNDIFYSYSTCNSTDHFWQQQLGSSATNVSVIGGINIAAAVPASPDPMLYKQLPDGTKGTDVYFDDSVPFGGIYIDYINELVKISNGDIQNVTSTHISKGSLKRYPASSFTAAVQDVENRLVDMAVGPFWITGQRLKMTSFTVPLVYDKTVLVIPKPVKKKGLAYEAQKVFSPFTPGLWGVVIAIIFAAALLSVWFSDREMVAKKRYGLQLKQARKPWKRQKFVYFRLILDAFLEKGMFFFSAGIEQDTGASLPHKVLMFGFGFFILIAVSAYVAELAAMLTQSGLETNYDTMKKVIDGNIAICGPTALEEEIRQKWPKANWIFPNDEFDGVFEAYARGECKVLAVGREDKFNILTKLCDNGLVYTDDLIHENPIAFPIRPELASAFSYWMYTAKKSYGVSLESAKQAFIEENENEQQCKVELSNLGTEADDDDDFPRVSTTNMFLPIMAFVACVFTAVVLQLIHENERKKGRSSSIGRKSTLDLYEIRRRTVEDGDEKRDVRRKGRGLEDEDHDDDDDSVMPRSKSTVVKRSLTHGKSDVGGDAKRIQICDFPGANITGDEFNKNNAPQSTQEPKSVFRGLIEDTDVTNGGADEAAKEGNDVSHRMEELVDSGVIEDVFDCFDLFKEMKKLKKDQ